MRAVVQTLLSQPAATVDDKLQALEDVQPVSGDVGAVNTVKRSVAPASEEAAHGKLLRKLSEFDDRLVEVLREGDIRLVRATWVRTQPPGCLLPRRQELEALGPLGTVPSPLLSCEEAVTLIRGSGRGVGVLSHAWLTAAHPDPEGSRMAIVQRVLEDHPHVEALFWE